MIQLTLRVGERCPAGDFEMLMLVFLEDRSFEDAQEDILDMPMLESFEGRGFEDSEVEHSWDTLYTDIVHFGKEVLQVAPCMEVALAT